ncbi:MAG: hypothetical protein AB2L13_10565 [Spirochaetota bacterium]
MKDFPHDAIVAAAKAVFDAAQGKQPRTLDVPAAPTGGAVVDLEEWRRGHDLNK